MRPAMAMPSRFSNVFGTLPATATSQRLMNIEATEPTSGLSPAAMRRSMPGEADNDTSGTSLAPSAGTPVPICHDGLEKNTLAPPPLADGVPLIALSFQEVSGMTVLSTALRRL